MWKKCLKGDLKSWKLMVKYCRGDISLLEGVYLRLRPYISRHPNIVIEGDEIRCPSCSSTNVVKNGFSYTGTAKYQRLKCNDCGSNCRRKFNLLEKIQKERLTTSI